MGLEYIVQPQVFLGGLTALGPGIQGLTENYPLLTTYYSWTSTASVNTSSFPIPIAVGSIYNGPGKEASFIVSVGSVVQSPTEYTVDPILRTITFSSVVSAGIEFAATQLATASPSSQNFNYVKSVSAEFTTLTATNGSFNNLVVTNLTALSTTVNVIDIRISEVSGFRATGNVDVFGNVNVTNSINLTGSLVAANITTNILSAREIDLVHTPANDGVDPILDIGETTTDGFSGIRVRYEESSNRLLVQTVAPSLTSNSVIIDRATGQVGISAIPNQALTVAGNISATGAIRAINTWPNIQYFMLTTDEGLFAANTVFALMSSQPITITPNQIYNITAFFALSSTSGTTTSYTFGFSGNNVFTVIDGTATNVGSIQTVLTYGRDLRGSTPGTGVSIFPAQTYNTGAGTLVTSSCTARISANTTTQILISGTANAAGRVKAGSNWSSTLIG